MIKLQCRQTDRQQCIRAHRALGQVGSKSTHEIFHTNQLKEFSKFPSNDRKETFICECLEKDNVEKFINT